MTFLVYVPMYMKLSEKKESDLLYQGCYGPTSLTSFIKDAMVLLHLKLQDDMDVDL